MRRVLLSFIIAIAFLCNTASAQLEVVFVGPPTVVQNGQVSVDVAVNNFTNVISAQFSINWDSLVLNYNSIINVTSILDGVTFPGSIAVPAATGAVGPGQATFSWSLPSTNPRTIPDGTVLFTIVFDGNGPCMSSTDLIITDDPRDIEVIIDDGNFTDISAVSNGANILIDCGGDPPDCGPNNGNPNCGSGNINGLGLIGSDGLVESGEEYCVEMTVENFDDVQSWGITVNWDSSLLTYSHTQNWCTDLPGLGAAAFNLSGSGDALIGAWIDNSGVNPANLPDGKVIFEVCFDAIGPNGSYADVSFSNVEFGDSNQEIIDSYTDCGSVEICIPIVEPGGIDVTIPDVTGVVGDMVCIDILVDGFQDVSTFQFELLYDMSLLTFTGIDNVNSLITPSPLFNEDPPGAITLNWFESNGNGVNLADGSTMFSVCFEVLGDCPDPNPNTASIEFSTDFDVEFANSSDEVITPVTVNGGNINIICPDPPETCMCSLNVTQPDCSGGVGSITINTGDCEVPIAGCEWTLNGLPISPGGCSLFAAQEGNWAVTVTDDNGATCVQQATIAGPAAVTFGGVVTDVSCDGLGSITLNTLMGGSGGYTFKWSNGATTQTIIGLPAADYTVTVCDVNSCNSMPMTFTVDNIILPLTATVAVDSGCTENDGTAVATVSGGCIPYSTTNPSGVVVDNTVTYTGLAAGDYSDIITDVNGTPVTVMWTIEDIPLLEITLVDTVCSSVNDDGKIMFSTTGGTMPYTYGWSPVGGTINITEDTLCNLPVGTYGITVTDDRNCTAELTDIVIEMCPDTMVNTLQISSFTVVSDYNGSGVSCNGACDGSLSAVFIEATGVVTVVLTDESGMTWDNLDVDTLCAGMYTLTAMDDSGDIATQTVEITEPEQISITIDNVTCADEGVENGGIDISVTGGTAPYSYVWTGGSITEDIEDQAAGFYTVLVTDANGCSNMIQSIEIECCDCEEINCFVYNNIITPGNMDGFNDVLEIACADTSTNTLTIFDRWGREVYGAVNYQNDWRGTTTDGDDLGEGTYFHILEVSFLTGERRIYKGSVTILRDL